MASSDCPTWMDVASSGDADLSKRQAADLTGLKTVTALWDGRGSRTSLLQNSG